MTCHFRFTDEKGAVEKLDVVGSSSCTSPLPPVLFCIEHSLSSSARTKSLGSFAMSSLNLHFSKQAPKATMSEVVVDELVTPSPHSDASTASSVFDHGEERSQKRRGEIASHLYNSLRTLFHKGVTTR